MATIVEESDFVLYDIEHIFTACYFQRVWKVIRKGIDNLRREAFERGRIIGPPLLSDRRISKWICRGDCHCVNLPYRMGIWNFDSVAFSR